MEKESACVTTDDHHIDVNSVMDGIADMTQSGEIPLEEDNAGQEEVVFGPACTFGILLQNSKLNPLCEGEVKLLSSVKKKEQTNLLNRSGQYDLEANAIDRLIEKKCFFNKLTISFSFSPGNDSFLVFYKVYEGDYLPKQKKTFINSKKNWRFI